MNAMTYQGRPYTPIDPPTPDSETLAERGDRLIFIHDIKASGLVVAPKRILHYGMVVGVFDLGD